MVIYVTRLFGVFFDVKSTKDYSIRTYKIFLPLIPRKVIRISLVHAKLATTTFPTFH